MKIAFILGTRPEILKLAPLIAEAHRRGLSYIIIHTNQHYDFTMDQVFFEELDLPQPQYNLSVGSDMPGAQTGKMMMGLEQVLLKEAPSVVVVQGDTNTVLAGALVGSKLGIPVAHVEAGLRSYDRSMPEEINRIVVDHISSFLFCPTQKQLDIASAESIPRSSLFVTGNTIVDAIRMYSELSKSKSTILDRLKIANRKYVLLTCHRPSNTENPGNLENILQTLNKICSQEDMVCIFPTHPRVRERLTHLGPYHSILTTNPVGYLDMIQLQISSQCIFTDSGGIQEEACILQKRCLILRKNTERPETLEVGGAILLSDISPDEIEKRYHELRNRKVVWHNPFGDGKASQKILDILCAEGH